MTNPEPSGWLWLWDELARRLGPAAAADLKAAYREQQRRHEKMERKVKHADYVAKLKQMEAKGFDTLYTNDIKRKIAHLAKQIASDEETNQ